MSTITAQLNARILNAIVKPPFKAVDWVFSSGVGQSGTVGLLIKYAYHPAFFFKASIPKRKEKANPLDHVDFVIPVSFSPGEATADEASTVVGIEALIRLIDAWTVRIGEELSAAPHARRQAEQQAQIDEIVDRIGEVETLGNEIFTRQEAEAFRARISKLEADLIDAVKQQELDAKAQQEAIDGITRDMEELRQAASALNKKGAARKVVAWGVSVVSPAIAKALGAGGAELVHRLLPPP